MRSVVAVVVIVFLALGTAAPVAAEPRPGFGLPTELPLGPAGLAEQRSVRELTPGVTLYRIVRGAVDPDDGFTATAGFAVTEAEAASLEARVRSAGLVPRRDAAVAPLPGVPAGWAVRVGLFTTPAQADALLPALRAAGLSPRVDATVDDGASTDGPWRVNLLVIDPRRFRGSLRGVLARDANFGRETTSSMAARSGAVAAVNGGFFTIDGTRDVPGPWLEGTDGDPAGIAVVDGKLLSEAVNDRPALVLARNDRAQIRRLGTALRLDGPRGARHEITGVNRVPGLVVNCGGVGSAFPTSAPLHDFTCGNADELVLFTEDYGTVLPSGEGYQAVLDRHGRVLGTAPARGGQEPPAGIRVVQATGQAAAWLRANAVAGRRLTVSSRVLDTETARAIPLRRDLSVINGGPLLVDDGEVALDPVRDGWSAAPVAGTPRAEFFWRWYVRRNPRTAAGVLPGGQLVLLESDGRAPGWSAGLTIDETARLMDALGCRDAINLDGGGSSTMVANGALVSRPSDAAGERPAGDAIVIVPDR